MSKPEIIVTADGSHTLFNKELNETYHSIHGATQESLHVFINHGLAYLLSNTNLENIHILEIGFGTGLNALLTLQHITGLKQKIKYTSLEAFPIEEEIWSALNYASSPGLQDSYRSLHDASWGHWNLIQENFSLLKLHDTLQQINLPLNQYDLIYFDAFAPSKQPEMWSLPILQKVTSSMKQNSVFVTYCAKGQLKRDLKSLNLHVETLPGPPKKMQMVRGIMK